MLAKTLTLKNFCPDACEKDKKAKTMAKRNNTKPVAHIFRIEFYSEPHCTSKKTYCQNETGQRTPDGK